MSFSKNIKKSIEKKFNSDLYLLFFLNSDMSFFNSDLSQSLKFFIAMDGQHYAPSGTIFIFSIASSKFEFFKKFFYIKLIFFDIDIKLQYTIEYSIS